MSRLLIPLFTGLLWSGSCATQARELLAGDPTRASLVSLALNTPAAGLPADSRITLSRAWVDGAQAKVCALARGSSGDLLVQDGQLQMKRVRLRKQGSQWGVAHAERIAMGPDRTIDTACGQPSAEDIMTAAVQLLQTHPPTAGRARACPHAPLKQALTQVDQLGWVGAAGRTLLHSAPDSECLMGKHIVRGDKVNITGHLSGWAQVRYTHPITGVVTIGWIQSDRVKQGGDDSSYMRPINTSTIKITTTRPKPPEGP